MLTLLTRMTRLAHRIAVTMIMLAATIMKCFFFRAFTLLCKVWKRSSARHTLALNNRAILALERNAVTGGFTLIACRNTQMHQRRQLLITTNSVRFMLFIRVPPPGLMVLPGRRMAMLRSIHEFKTVPRAMTTIWYVTAKFMMVRGPAFVFTRQMKWEERQSSLLRVGVEAISEQRLVQTRVLGLGRVLRWTMGAWQVALAGLVVASVVALAANASIGFLTSRPDSDIPSSSNRIAFSTDCAVVAVLVSVVVAANLFVLHREASLNRSLLADRLAAILHSLWVAQKDDGFNPAIISLDGAPETETEAFTNVASVSVAKLLLPANNKVHILPHNLLLENDIILLSFGEKAPAAAIACTPDGSPFTPLITLQRGQLLKPSLFKQSAITTTPSPRGHMHFKLTETPLIHTLNALLYSRRPESVVYHQLHVITATLTSSVIPAILFLSLLVNIFRYAFLATTREARIDEALALLVLAQFYAALLPLLPLSLPVVCLVARAYGNAAVGCLHEALLVSKEDFKDEENIDDFDAAPPPTKEVETDYKAIWRAFWSQLLTPNTSHLARTTNLVESLASATVICAMDREGTVSMPFPSIDYLFFMNDHSGGGGMDAAAAAAASAGVFGGNAAEPVVLDIKDEPPSLQGGGGAGGGGVPGIRFEDKEWRTYLDSLKPLGLHFLLGASPRCGAAAAAAGLHVKDESTVGDVGGGVGGLRQRRQNRLRTENHRRPLGLEGGAEERVKPARQTCLCRVGRSIGFQDSSVEPFQLVTAVNWYSPKVDAASNVITHAMDYHFEVPSSKSQIFMHTGSGECQLFSEGNVELIVDSCVDYWTGSGLELMTDAVEKKIFEFYHNAVCADMQVIAYSYRPVPNGGTVGTLKEKTATYVERHASLDAVGVRGSEDDEVLKSEVAGSNRWKNRRIASVIDHPEYNSDSLGPDAYLRELLKCQTFLGLAALCYEPKPDISNVIEDLKLAGIRFVYFSEAPERESKAYAERLGLEIDWNACIILSSSPDGETPGYLELHDMKAQLPRGVDKVRSHIQNVDDVPLRVSLFAESDRSSVLEMVKIFQEYGEVVICIGSSLNEANAESFATADLAVAIDPFVVREGAGPGTGCLDAASPIMMGARITTSPCALHFHFDTSVYSLTQLIREARTLVMHAQQGFSFHFGCQMSLSGMMLLSYILLLPPIFTGYQLLWLLWIVFPVQAATFLFSPYDPDVMKLMPLKNNDHMKDKWRSARYFLARFAMATCGSVLVFVLSLRHFLTVNVPTSNPVSTIFGHYGALSWMRLNEVESAVLLYSQHVTLFYFVLCIVISSCTFLSRDRSLLELPPWRNKVWVVGSLFTITLQLIFSVVSLANGILSYTALPWHIIFVTVIGVLVNLPIQEYVKRHDKAHWIRSQKLAQLQFNTKLGMHSPL